jgi:hypothetical protein
MASIYGFCGVLMVCMECLYDFCGVSLWFLWSLSRVSAGSMMSLDSGFCGISLLVLLCLSMVSLQSLVAYFYGSMVSLFF